MGFTLFNPSYVLNARGVRTVRELAQSFDERVDGGVLALLATVHQAGLVLDALASPLADVNGASAQSRENPLREVGKMISIYRFNPAWNVPCVSPFVTKAIYYLRMADIPHEVKIQDFSRLEQDAPYGKLPYIEDDGVKIADSTAIIKIREEVSRPRPGHHGEREGADAGMEPDAR
jgi:hypothetical protein